MIYPPRILITPGEPAGIGPDVTLALAADSWEAELVVVADPELLQQRAAQLNMPLTLKVIDLDNKPSLHQPGTLNIVPVSLNKPVVAGQLDKANADYVIRTLTTAANLCQAKKASAIVTAPVNKEVINAAGIPFPGHTEFFAELAQVPHTVMLFVTPTMKVALVTTHLPLKNVPAAITKELLHLTLSTLRQGLKQQFQLTDPNIFVCGLNPHAGEGGYLGREEIEIITPALNELREAGYRLHGPLPADTIFTPKYLAEADVILSMYHDQALPVVKSLSFGHSVNVTLGLPYIRTSVDHGTALDLAGTGLAEADSLKAALRLAVQLS
ncbi:MAG: 4-hydroxythreonine-4-phosphate dehydrogenase PdxA [Gammaproteobacteria bacterium]